MTLQQKLLAKQSKKGFTLVELVVVIAILAILAAFAIPSVIGIIGSASESAGATEASDLNSACKTFYANVVSGTVTTSSVNADGSPVTAAAAPGASETSKRTAARSATVGDAAKYSGLTPNYDDLYFVNATGQTESHGTILFSSTAGSTSINSNTVSALTATTTLGAATAGAGLYLN